MTVWALWWRLLRQILAGRGRGQLTVVLTDLPDDIARHIQHVEWYARDLFWSDEWPPLVVLTAEPDEPIDCRCQDCTDLKRLDGVLT